MRAASFVTVGYALTSIACAQLPAGLQIELADIVHDRPARIVGPDDTEGSGPWRRLNVTMDRAFVQRLYREEMTLGVYFTDCAGSVFSVDDIYVGVTPLNHVASLNAARFADLLGSSRHISASMFLDEAEFQRNDAICADVHAGSMTGVRLDIPRLQIKP